MAFDIQLPNITGADATTKVAQLQSYIHQMVQQLNWALNSIETAEKSQNPTQNLTKASGGEVTQEEAIDTFNSIKSLIIKSADIVNAYYETMNESFSSEYTAQSDFGWYKEKADGEIVKNARATEQINTKVETIQTTVGDIDTRVKKTEGAIKSGYLDIYDAEGKELYGILIGEISEEDGSTKKAYASFTSDRLSFYGDMVDNKPVAIAYISDYKLYITNAEITGALRLGGYNLDLSDGIIYKWA